MYDSVRYSKNMIVFLNIQKKFMISPKENLVNYDMNIIS